MKKRTLFLSCLLALVLSTAALAEQGFSISSGLAVGPAVMGLNDLVREADERMLEQKRAYYSEHDRREAR